MKTIKQVIAMLLCISLCMPLAQAQPAPDKRQDAQTPDTIAQDVLIIIQQEQVRFTAQRAVEEMRLQIFDQAGQLVYDSGAVTGPELTWVLRQADGEAVKSGLYAYTLSIKEAGAADTRTRRGHFIVDRAEERDGKTDRLWITSRNESGVGTELTVARTEGGAIAGTSITVEQKSVGSEQAAARDGEAETKNESDATAAPAAANGTIGRIAKFTSAADLGNSVITELNGNVGIGTSAPKSGLHVHSNGSFSPILLSTGSGSEGPAEFRVQADSGLFGQGRSFVIYDDIAKQYRMVINGNGNVGIGTWQPTHKLEIAGQFGLRIAGYQPFLTLTDTNAVFGESRIQNVNGGLNFQTHDLTQSGGTAMYIQNNTHNIGIGTPTPQAKLDVAGQTRTQSLQITGGADFAENFEVNAAPAGSELVAPKIEPGMVVSIDPERPGKLMLSARAYNTQVAGVISGAGGVKPGMVMSQEGTLADGEFPVALTGRVYCWVDAAYGAIKPGDLLTTAPTPGHAMKATDREKAHGAIIGKAMTGLKEGKGLVLVLVNLQ